MKQHEAETDLKQSRLLNDECAVCDTAEGRCEDPFCLCVCHRRKRKK